MAALPDFATLRWAYCDLQTVLVLGAALLLTCWYLLPWGRGNLPPGPWGWPALGNLLSLGKYPYEAFVALSRKYGDVFHIRMGSMDVVVLNSYKAIHEALVKKGEYFSDKPRFYLHEKSGHYEYGVALLPYGKFWKDQRTFCIASLRDFGLGRRSLERKIVEEIGCLQHEIRSTKGEATNVRLMLLNAVANIIYSVVVGERFDYDNPTFKMMMKALHESTGESLFNQLENFIPAYRLIAVAKDAIEKITGPPSEGRVFYIYIRKCIEEHRQSFEPSDLRDFLDTYLLEMRKREHDSDNRFTETQLIVLIIELLGAGSETSAVTLYWALLYMTLYPDVQQRVQDEIERVIGRDQEPSMSHQNDLPFTRAVITEVMRINTISPLSSPRAASNDSTISGYDIPKGTMILVNLWAVLHDPDVYPEPHKFNPDRFLDQNGKFFRPETFIPFSAGRRNCFGQQLARMELFLFFAHLMQQFTFKVPEGAPEPPTRGTFGQNLLFPPDYELSASPRE